MVLVIWSSPIKYESNQQITEEQPHSSWNLEMYRIVPLNHNTWTRNAQKSYTVKNKVTIWSCFEFEICITYEHTAKCKW